MDGQQGLETLRPLDSQEEKRPVGHPSCTIIMGFLETVITSNPWRAPLIQEQLSAPNLSHAS
jgi:hypothetical protein